MKTLLSANNFCLMELSDQARQKKKTGPPTVPPRNWLSCSRVSLCVCALLSPMLQAAQQSADRSFVKLTIRQQQFSHQVATVGCVAAAGFGLVLSEGRSAVLSAASQLPGETGTETETGTPTTGAALVRGPNTCAHHPAMRRTSSAQTRKHGLGVSAQATENVGATDAPRMC